jgi:hypothetical protein
LTFNKFAAKLGKIKESVSQLKQFRQAIYEAFDLRRDALMELIDALSSMPDAHSVVELSLSSFFRREYSSVYDAIANIFFAQIKAHGVTI